MMVRQVNQVMAKYEQEAIDKNKPKRESPVSGIYLRSKFERKNTKTFQLDAKTAQHQMSFLRFKT